MEQKYDSKVDTEKHIARVGELMAFAASVINQRGIMHNASKLGNVEKPFYDKYTPILKELTFGSEEYKNNLETLKTALTNHYKNNRHHPEHFNNGIDGMNLFDIVEMFFDWVAATERTKDGNIHDSIKANKDRFKMSDQLVNIFNNTISDINLVLKKNEK